MHDDNAGDDFDLSPFRPSEQPEQLNLNEIAQNPLQLIESLDLDAKQTKNVKSIITGGGAGLIHQWLSPHIGDELAGGVGGFLAAYLAKRVIGGGK